MVILTSKWSSFPKISHKGVPEYQACLSAVHCRPGPSNDAIICPSQGEASRVKKNLKSSTFKAVLMALEVT